MAVVLAMSTYLLDIHGKHCNKYTSTKIHVNSYKILEFVTKLFDLFLNENILLILLCLFNPYLIYLISVLNLSHDLITLFLRSI